MHLRMMFDTKAPLNIFPTESGRPLSSLTVYNTWDSMRLNIILQKTNLLV